MDFDVQTAYGTPSSLVAAAPEPDQPARRTTFAPPVTGVLLAAEPAAGPHPAADHGAPADLVSARDMLAVLRQRPRHERPGPLRQQGEPEIRRLHQLRSLGPAVEHPTESRPTGPFHGRNRAVNDPSAVVFTDMRAVWDLAVAKGLHAVAYERVTEFREAYPGLLDGMTCILDQPMARTACWAKQPEIRGPRLDAAAGKSKVLPVAGVGTYETGKTTLEGPCQRGDVSQTRQAAMNNLSARNYAIGVGCPDAEKHTWEWLHLVGSAIGGGNVRGNLVAGTYDANTLMIPLEQRIVEYSRRPNVTKANPLEVWATAKLWNGFWVAEEITLHVEHDGNKFSLGPITSKIDKLTRFEYDFYRLLFQEMMGNKSAEDEYDSDGDESYVDDGNMSDAEDGNMSDA
jgi:hypothetical protein